MQRIACVVGCIAIAFFVSPAIATAENSDCEGGSVFGTVDNIVVPPHTDCLVYFAVVRGNVTALLDSGVAVFGSEVAGNVQGDPESRVTAVNSGVGGNIEVVSPGRVGVQNSTVGGNIDITGATGPGQIFGGLSVTVFVCKTILPDGNIEVDKSSGGTITIGTTDPICEGNDLATGNITVQKNVIPVGEAMTVTRNSVGGNVQVSKNEGPGQKFVTENDVQQDLQCRKNEQPFVGGPNVARTAEGQCFLGP